MKKTLSKLQFLLFFGVVHLLCASLSFASPVEAAWRLGLAGANTQDSQTSNQYVSFGLDAKTKYWANRSLFINFDALLKFENGNFQSIDGERQNESGVALKEVGAHWFMADTFIVSAGALNQSTNHSPLLFGDQAFPALRAQWKAFRTGNWQTQLDLEQAIPTSSSLSTNNTSTEATPQFSSASLALNYETYAYFWKTRVGAFSFDNLPSATAYQSGLRGNTVTSTTGADAAFAYQYAGLDAETTIRIPVVRGWDAVAGAAYLQNNKAPSDSNRAYSVSLGSEFFFVGQKSLEFNASSFRIESDAAVAYFNSPYFYHTNRLGYNFEAFMNFRKSSFRVGVAYTEAEVIYLSPVQSREKSLRLMLETFYANI